MPNPGYTPYYSKSFFLTIKDVKDNSPLNPLYMSVKYWYRFLLEKNDEGRTELIPCKVEEKNPDVHWNEAYGLCRLKGLGPDEKSFLFKLIHTLLPSKEMLCIFGNLINRKKDLGGILVLNLFGVEKSIFLKKRAIFHLFPGSTSTGHETQNCLVDSRGLVGHETTRLSP